MLEADHLRKTFLSEKNVMQPEEPNQERVEAKANKKMQPHCSKGPGQGRISGSGWLSPRENAVRVHGSSKFNCMVPECNSKYSNNQRLREHMWVKHALGKGVQCDECGRRRYSPLDLKDHMRIAHGAPKLECDVLGCSSTFTCSANLKRHMKDLH